MRAASRPNRFGQRRASSLLPASLRPLETLVQMSWQDFHFSRLIAYQTALYNTRCCHGKGHTKNGSGNSIIAPA